ncbi:MAG: hypothetical protein HOV94_02790 [Saccharothrix sp.]|nr:hypothetical protein [Saccharothrix sp.]
MDDLVAWLRDRLDAERDVYVRVIEGEARWMTGRDGGAPTEDDIAALVASERDEDREGFWATQDAHRRILDACRAHLDPTGPHHRAPDHAAAADLAELVLRALGLVYRDGPDYRPEWQPTDN